MDSLRDRFSPKETIIEEVEASAQTCIDLNRRHKRNVNKVCISESDLLYLEKNQVTRYDRATWEEYLGLHLQRWQKELGLKTVENSEVSIYMTSKLSDLDEPLMLIDIENSSWLVRFSVPLDPDKWAKNKRNEFFLDRAFVRPKPFTGNIVVQWKDKTSLKNIEKIIDLYPEATVLKKQGLTWLLKTRITDWQEFARSFVSSPYIKKNLKKWRSLPYSTNIEPKEKLISLGYKSIVEKLNK